MPIRFRVVDLLEVKIDQYRVASFDGRVLEIFGGSVRRFPGELLSVTGSRPDKKGKSGCHADSVRKRRCPSPRRTAVRRVPAAPRRLETRRGEGRLPVIHASATAGTARPDFTG